MWPYWLDGHATNTVKNSFDMSSMYLLTGRPSVHDNIVYHHYAIIDCYLLHSLTIFFSFHLVVYYLVCGASCDSSHVLASKHM